MSEPQIITLDARAPEARIGIVLGRFNALIGDRLLEAAVATLRAHGVAPEDIEVVRVPGAYEIPLAAQVLAESGRFQALVALGAVIRGETPHFDFVAGECSRGVLRVMLDRGIPIGFGVLTVNDAEQAMERAGGRLGNKGEDAALAALEMLALLRHYRP
jgi:6,7-dimethyl-8-ribityllumazine synthase